jgi:hypothetical protein
MPMLPTQDGTHNCCISYRPLSSAAGFELTFDIPGPSIWFESLADPVERILLDFRETPARRSAVDSRADLHDFVSNFAAGLTRSRD